MVGPTTDVADKSVIAKALREYCALDTYAMYAIWRVLGEGQQQCCSKKLQSKLAGKGGPV